MDYLKTDPKRIFLIDSLGALLTAIFLLGILAPLEPFFGMPKEVLYWLSGAALCLFIYSISCHKLIKSNWKPFLGIIIISNTIYSLVSFGLLLAHFEKLTKLGLIYFIMELVVIEIVVIIEFKSYSTSHAKELTD